MFFLCLYTYLMFLGKALCVMHYRTYLIVVVEQREGEALPVG